MHAWSPAYLKSAVGKRVLLAEIVGPRDKVEALQRALHNARPNDQELQFTLVEQQQLQPISSIQLASATSGMPSDVALLHAARDHGMDYLLIGEILERRQDYTGIGRVDQDAVGDPHSKPQLDPHNEPAIVTVSWRMLDVQQGRQIGGQPICITAAHLEKFHPDLAQRRKAGGEEAVWEAAARDSWRLLVPHVRPLSSRLANPYLQPYASKIRYGNGLAEQGLWPQAEACWQEVIDKSPGNHAAMHNLALAAAARQDLTTAKRMAQSALRLHHSPSYQETVVWIEQRQIELSQAFGIAPPREGWLFTREPISR